MTTPNLDALSIEDLAALRDSAADELARCLTQAS